MILFEFRYRFFRKKDREINEEKYPFLLYPHIYLLDGGYNKFVKYNAVILILFKKKKNSH